MTQPHTSVTDSAAQQEMTIGARVPTVRQREAVAETQVVVRRYGRRLQIDSSAPIDLRWLRTHPLTPVFNDQGYYQVVRQSESLLDSANIQPHAALDWFVVRGLIKSGFDVCRVMSAIPSLAAVDPASIRIFGSRDVSLYDFVRLNAEGIVRYDPQHVDRAWLISQIAIVFPEASVAVVTATNADARKFGERLRKNGTDVSIVNVRWCPDQPRRVVVGTMGSMHHTEIAIEGRTFLFVLKATDALHERPWPTFMPTDARFRLFGFLPFAKSVSPYENDRLLAMFGAAELSVPKHGHRLTQVATAWIPFVGQIVGCSDATIDLKRVGYWEHRVRSRRIARLAAAVRGRDGSWLQHAAPEVGAATATRDDDRQPRVAVVTETLAHAIDIADRLHDWPLLVDLHANEEGLSQRQQTVLNYRRQLPVVDGCFVATVAGIENESLANLDVLISAGGGQHPLPLTHSAMTYCGTENRQLLLVDIDDRHHPDLARWSSCRRRAYRRQGWFAAGTDPFMGRIDRFLGHRNRSNSVER